VKLVGGLQHVQHDDVRAVREDQRWGDVEAKDHRLFANEGVEAAGASLPG